MRTPAHWVLTLAAARAAWPREPAAARAAALGAVIPDLPYWLLGMAMATRRRSRRQLRARLGYDGSELNWPPDLAAHSVLAPAAVLAAAAMLLSSRLAALGAGWAGHILCDIPVHHSDARPHGYPLSSRRFHSPLSFWDRRRHAGLVTAAELMLGATAIAVLAKGPQGARPLWSLRDIIVTGTPPGVALGMKPQPVFLKPGDVVTLGIEGLGEQRQKVVAAK